MTANPTMFVSIGTIAASCGRQVEAEASPDRVFYSGDPMYYTANRTKPPVSVVRKILSVSLLSAALTLPTYGQKTTHLGEGGGGSERVRSEWILAPAKISIEYGRPALQGRSEAEVMPTGVVWRAGADEATILTTDKALKFGTVTLQPGRYTINTLPGASEWQLLLGTLSNPRQWGSPYKPELAIGRISMRLSMTAAPVELVTFHIDPATSAGILRVEWGIKSASIPFVVLP